MNGRVREQERKGEEIWTDIETRGIKEKHEDKE